MVNGKPYMAYIRILWECSKAPTRPTFPTLPEDPHLHTSPMLRSATEAGEPHRNGFEELHPANVEGSAVSWCLVTANSSTHGPPIFQPFFSLCLFLEGMLVEVDNVFCPISR